MESAGWAVWGWTHVEVELVALVLGEAGHFQPFPRFHTAEVSTGTVGGAMERRGDSEDLISDGRETHAGVA